MKKIPIAALALVLAAACEAKVLAKADKDEYVYNRGHKSWEFPGVDIAKGRVVVDFYHRID
jgi:hypothetical protein